ncbi:glycosyltransferase [Scytonema sp. NUACC21]
MPKISVIIPAYNAEKTIRATIDSVLEQTFRDFELIIINDGSTDNTLELLHSIQDARLKIFSYANSGLPVARNRGLARATSEYIAFLDADDLWASDKLELQLLTLEQNPEAGVAYSWTYFMDVDEQGNPVSFLPSPSYCFVGDVYKNLLVSDFIHSGSNTLIRKEAIESAGEFDSTLKSCEDWDYWLRLAAQWDFVPVFKHQIFYRRTPGAMSSKVEVMKQASLIAMEKAYKAAPPELQYLKKYTLTNFHKYCASLYLQYHTDIDGLNQAQQHLWSAIYLHPQTLLERATQKLLIKLLVKRIFPPNVTRHLFYWIRKALAISNPRLQA